MADANGSGKVTLFLDWTVVATIGPVKRTVQLPRDGPMASHEGCHPGIPTYAEEEDEKEQVNEQTVSIIGKVIERKPDESSYKLPSAPKAHKVVLQKKVIAMENEGPVYNEEEMMKEISFDNMEIINELTVEEIQEEQARLRSTLPPKLLEKWSIPEH